MGTPVEEYRGIRRTSVGAAAESGRSITTPFRTGGCWPQRSDLGACPSCYLPAVRSQEGAREMILNFGRWSNAAGQWFVAERIYCRGRWTPLCRLRRRYR